MHTKFQRINRLNKFFRGKYIYLRNKIILFNNRRKTLASLKFKGKIPYVALNEKYEPYVKWLLRILTIIVIGISLFTLPFTISIILTIFLIVVEKILENVIFQFTTLFIQPMPEYELGSWLAMIYLFNSDTSCMKMGMVFPDEGKAKAFLDCIRSWNYFENNDINNNICISFIIEDGYEEYSTYIYPSYERESIMRAKEIVEKERLEKREFKDHTQLVICPIMCRSFPNPPQSSFRMFTSRYNAGDMYEFGVFAPITNIPELTGDKPYILKEGEIIEVMKDKSIMKTHLRIAKRSDLSDKDLEYSHGRLIMEM